MIGRALRLLLLREGRSVYCSGVNSRPTIRVVSHLYSKRTKPCPIANEKALTSWSNRSNEFLRPDGFDDLKWWASGRQLVAITEQSECRLSVRMSEILTMPVVSLRFVICYPVLIFI